MSSKSKVASLQYLLHPSSLLILHRGCVFAFPARCFDTEGRYGFLLAFFPQESVKKSEQGSRGKERGGYEGRKEDKTRNNDDIKHRQQTTRVKS